MMANVLILGGHVTPSTIKQLDEKVRVDSDSFTKIIVKKGDDYPPLAPVVVHEAQMMGEVCDLLWEAVSLDQGRPLVIASASGYLRLHQCEKAKAELTIVCDEFSFAGFVFDADGTMMQSGRLSGSNEFLLRFSSTGTFVKMAQSIILAGKLTNGLFTLGTLVNQCILQRHSIDVVCIKD